MLDNLLHDLTQELPPLERLQRLVQTLKDQFHGSAVGLLMIEDDSLRLLAAEGLSY